MRRHHLSCCWVCRKAEKLSLKSTNIICVIQMGFKKLIYHMYFFVKSGMKKGDVKRHIRMSFKII